MMQFSLTWEKEQDLSPQVFEEANDMIVSQ